jgi:hypothetical protein
MNLLLAVILGVMWVLGFGVFHVMSPAIHLLLVLSLLAFVFHFLQGIPPRRW